MAEVVSLHKPLPTIRDAVAKAFEDHPDATQGVIFLFNGKDNADLTWYYNLSPQQMAYVAMSAMRMDIDDDETIAS